MSKIKHLAFLSPHGNFDKENGYYTEHPDFGKEQLYIKKLAKSLAEMEIQVDIITRQINDPEWPEEFSDLYDQYPNHDNLRIIRLPFGGRKFLAKEKLWPHLKIYVDAVANFYDEEGFLPDYFTAHYGDGGLAGVLLKEKLEIPFAFTAHSLAAQKMDDLNFNKENSEELIKKFKFHSRLIAERLAMNFANQIIVTSVQEKREKYSHPYYKNAVNINNEEKFSIIPAAFNNIVSNSSNPDNFDQKNNYSWQDTAKAYLKAMEKSMDSEIKVDQIKVPAYYFLPDSDNEHKLLDEFYKKVFKK